MKLKLDLKTVANQIAEQSGGKAKLQKKFEGVDEYFVSEVKEQDLLDLEFNFEGYSTYGISPCYTKNNILAYFEDEVLHVMETTYSAD